VTFPARYQTGTPVIARRRVVTHAELGPVELSAIYVPVQLATGTALAETLGSALGVKVLKKIHKNGP
jgi:GntR family transcriptional regulator